MLPKTIGILGGAGPLAGAQLLERLLRLLQQNYGCSKDADFPKIVLISFPFSEMLAGDIDVPKIREELKQCLRELVQCGAEVLAIACNTLHSFLDEEIDGLVHMPKAVAGKLEREAPLVLCTSTSARFELHKRFFPCTYLDQGSQGQLDEVIDAILRGEEKVEDKLKEIVERQGSASVVLGCTELSLVKDQFGFCNRQIIDPLEIVAESILVKSFRR
jgi:aspartate racemase